jgi:hypothetical protein
VESGGTLPSGDSNFSKRQRLFCAVELPAILCRFGVFTMTPNERWELLKAELDGREFRSVTATMSAARSTRAGTTNERRGSGNGSRCRKLLKSGNNWYTAGGYLVVAD